jgi:2-polyprenyl-6-methoxyphenol hydroxylase-like FAD-dependent oxidoreductase
MHGIVLKNLGHNVRILERNSLSTQKSLGAGIAAFEDVHKLIDKYDVTKIPYTVQSKGVQFLAPDNKIKSTWNVQLKMTSWNLLYYMMRANYDGMVSALCPEVPSTSTLPGKAVYEHGRTVTGVEKVDGSLTVHFQDAKTGQEESAEADLVIAADGTTSKLRQLLEPELQRKYAGYVAWRGTAPEQEISQATRDTFACKTTFFVMKKSYIVLYVITPHFHMIRI